MFAMLFLVASCGLDWPGMRIETARPGLPITGFAVAGMLASSASAVTVSSGMAVGLVLTGLAEQGSPGPVRRSAHTFSGSMRSWVILIASFVGSLIFFFSRGLSSFGALAGIGATFGDWIELLTDETSGTPTQFFLLSLLLYEIVFVVAAVAGFLLGVFDKPGRLGSVFFLGWFVTALLIFSFSAGRLPEHAIHVAMPIVIDGWRRRGQHRRQSWLEQRAMAFQRTPRADRWRRDRFAGRLYRRHRRSQLGIR